MASLLIAHSLPPLSSPRDASFSPLWFPKLPNSAPFSFPPDSRRAASALSCKDAPPHSPSRVFRQAVSDAASLTQPSLEGSRTQDEDVLPTPIVVIDQESDPDATVVEMSFGNRLGALLDTMQALTELGLNVVKSRISVEGPVGRKRFSITRVDGRKIDDPEMLEAIRLTIISNMLQYHPESSTLLAMGQAFGTKPPDELDVDIATHIHISDDGPQRSLLYVETADRPGLLREIVKVLADINVVFESGEFDTEGLLAKAKFHVNYRGAALIKPMKQVLINCFHYFLRRPETNEDSY